MNCYTLMRLPCPANNSIERVEIKFSKSIKFVILCVILYYIKNKLIKYKTNKIHYKKQ